MNYVELHIGDYEKATAHLTAAEDGIYGRLIRRYYDTEAPLPAEIKAVQRLVRARSRDEREAVETILDEFFTLTDDGWRHKRCDEEIERFREKEPERAAKRENQRERQRRARARRADLFNALRDRGVVPPYDTTTAELERLLSRATSQPVTPPVTRDDTANQTPDTRHQTKAPPARTPPTPTPEASPTDAGRACLLMRQAGCSSTNPSHPGLIAALAEGVTPEVLADTVREAVDSGKPKPFAWAIATARGRHSEGADPIATGPPRRTTTPEPSRRVAAIQTLLQGTSDAREPELAERRDQARLEPAGVPVPRLGSGG